MANVGDAEPGGGRDRKCYHHEQMNRYTATQRENRAETDEIRKVENYDGNVGEWLPSAGYGLKKLRGLNVPVLRRIRPQGAG